MSAIGDVIEDYIDNKIDETIEDKVNENVDNSYVVQDLRMINHMWRNIYFH